MAEFVIEVETGRASLDEIRGDVDATVDKHFPLDFLEFRWRGEVLHITGPGAGGSLVFDSGRLRVQVTLRPPASLMRPVIEHKIRSAFEDALSQQPAGSPLIDT